MVQPVILLRCVFRVGMSYFFIFVFFLSVRPLPVCPIGFWPSRSPVGVKHSVLQPWKRANKLGQRSQCKGPLTQNAFLSLKMRRPPPGSSDWSTVLELALMSGVLSKNLIVIFYLTRHLNAAFMCETLQKTRDASATVIQVLFTLKNNVQKSVLEWKNAFCVNRGRDIDKSL